MPHSSAWAIPFVMETLHAIQPKSVLDIGVGNGQYGFQIRQHLDIAKHGVDRDQWEMKLIGVEVFEQYRNPIWDYYYDEVVIGDGSDWIIETKHTFDVVLICDVIEHLSRNRALEVLESARKKAGTVIVTTPSGAMPQGAVLGNEAERHISEWVPSDFEGLGASTRGIDVTFMAVFSSDQNVHRFVRKLPAVFRHSGRQLVSITREWFPRMVESRFGSKHK